MWSNTLKLNYPDMTKAQKKAADYLMENTGSVTHMTIRECAAGAEVGQPTIIRMLINCGYQGWLEFCREAWKESGRTGIEILETRENTVNIQKQHSAVIRTIQDDIQMIAKMSKLIELEQLDQLVKIIKKAKVIDVYGTDNSANAANELAGRLLHLGFTSRNYSDLFFQKISAGHLHGKDVAIGFSMAGETNAIVQAIGSAKLSGAVTVAVTGDASSTLAKEADFIMMTPTLSYNEESKWISSRVTQIVFVDILCAAIIESNQSKYKKCLNRSTEEFAKDISEKAKQQIK